MHPLRSFQHKSASAIGHVIARQSARFRIAVSPGALPGTGLETTWRRWREPGTAAALMGLEAFDTVRPDPFGSRWPTPLP
jgi:hypothetical protein